MALLKRTSKQTISQVSLNPIIMGDIYDGQYDTYNMSSIMLITIAIIFLVLWLIGVVTAYTLGGLVHLLLVVALVLVVIRLIQGKPVI